MLLNFTGVAFNVRNLFVIPHSLKKHTTSWASFARSFKTGANMRSKHRKMAL